VIAIISSNTRERAAFCALCESVGWPYVDFESLRHARRAALRVRPKGLLTRHRLIDGYSDDILRAPDDFALTSAVRIIVLIAAGSPTDLEARQISLGADVVLRDPVRADVILAYLERFRALAGKLNVGANDAESPAASEKGTLDFAGARLDVLNRNLHHKGKTTFLSPREVELMQLLAEMPGEVASYEMLYSELLQRKFRGETANMRVLLGKLCDSCATVGLPLRSWIQVIPKTGYRYLPAPRR
jgi:DNA-binding response OmpR family regulator